jgi:hypothetical protein
MTSAQMRYILETVLGLDASASATYLPGISGISTTKKEIIFTDVASKRFRFDLDKGLMERWNCSVYSKDISKVPAHGHYDIVYSNEAKTAGTVYSYAVDPLQGNAVQKDYYDISNIICVVAGKDLK